MFRLERRLTPSPAIAATTPILAVTLTMVTGGVLFAMLGVDPVDALLTIFWAPLFDPDLASYARPQILVKAAPLILIAIGLAVGFRANIWNIGAEGQYVMGAIAGGALALACYPLDTPWLFPAMLLAAALGGAAWALVPALLKVRFGTNEILVSLMLVYVAEHFLAAVALGALRNPDGLGFPGSRNLQDYDSAANGELIAGTGIHLGIFAAALAALIAHLIFRSHIAGFLVDVAGQSARAARLAGVRPAAITIGCLAISGGLAGLAGIFELAGPSGQISIEFNVGYGFTAIIVAFLGRLKPIGIVFAGLLMALTYIGGEIAQFTLGLPLAAIQAFQGMLLFYLLALDRLPNIRLVRRSATALP